MPDPIVVFFDIDETLFDDTRATRAGAEVIRKRFRPEVEAREFLAAWERSIEAFFPQYLAGILSFQGQRRARVRTCIDEALGDAQADEVFHIYSAAYEASWTLFPDVLPGLSELSGYMLGVISNGESAQQRKKLEQAGLSEVFSWVVTPEDCGYAKPSPQIFEFACQIASVPPPAAIYVGDRLTTDALAATDAGLLGIWLDRRGEAPRDCSVPVIGSLLELKPYIEAPG